VVCHSGWILVGWFCCTGWTDPTTHISPGICGPQSEPSESGAGGVDPPYAAATLDRSSPNLTGADGAGIVLICWANRDGPGVRVDIDRLQVGRE